MSKKKVLVVEDDPNLGKLLTTFLSAKGFETVLADNGQKGFEMFNADSYDFLILDVMMPVKDGFTLAEDIREIDKEVPIMFLTAKSLSEDKLEGFKIGADDYLTKPFGMEELLARMNAILRRTSSEEEDTDRGVYEFDGFTYDFNRQMIDISGDQKKLTTKENQLFMLLCKNQNDILDRNAALRAVWGDDNYFNGRSMDVYIAKLRKYIKEVENVEIVNVHGKGFKLLIH